LAVLKIVPKLYQEKISEKLKEEISLVTNGEAKYYNRLYKFFQYTDIQCTADINYETRKMYMDSLEKEDISEKYKVELLSLFDRLKIENMPDVYSQGKPFSVEQEFFKQDKLFLLSVAPTVMNVSSLSPITNHSYRPPDGKIVLSSYDGLKEFEGIVNNIERRYRETSSESMKEEMENKYMIERVCKTCHGKRLKDEVLSITINDKSIMEICDLSIKDSLGFFNNLTLTKQQEEIAKEILKEIRERLSFMINVGLDYLTLGRETKTLSGGESQRIRLATQIGSGLTGVLYVLDEPSIGLHQRDNDKLLETLNRLKDIGNTLIVVEHDEDTMMASDYLIDMGPRAGRFGGEIVAKGTPQEVIDNPNSITGKYLKGEISVEIPKKRRKSEKYIELKGAKGNNLKNVNLKLPLGIMTAVTGVSGSGKSTLINQTLFPILFNKLNKGKLYPLEYKEINGLEHLDKVIDIDQSPIGRTPRSNTATYTKLFDDIRDIFSETKDSKMRGYSKGRFSFNVKGGRCEACQGAGI
jgi:excinuclease ABC subunit A